MTKTTMMKPIAAGFLLVAVFAGVSGAQTLRQSRALSLSQHRIVHRGRGRRRQLSRRARRSPNRPSGDSALLRLFNQDGAVVARKDVILQAGQSTTLQIYEPGLYRAHAEVRDSSSSACDRRTVRGTVEIFRPISPTPPPPEDTIESIILRVFRRPRRRTKLHLSSASTKTRTLSS